MTLTPVRIDTDVLKKAELPKVLQREMLTTRTEIIAATLKGQQADGGGLKPYSLSYKEAIDSGHIAGKAPGSHTPNLTATGELLRSMSITNTPDGAEMTFQGTHAPARRVSAAGAARKRKAGAITSTSLRGKGSVKSGGGGTRRRSSGGGASVPNATIAQAQYSQGRTGWMAFSAKAIQRIENAVGDAIARALANLVAKK